jgi:hypothetical protein
MADGQQQDARVAVALERLCCVEQNARAPSTCTHDTAATVAVTILEEE